MKKYINFILFLCLIPIIFCLCSCGHNCLTTTKGIGLDISWTGQSYIPNVRVGYWDAVSGITRGNAAVSTTTSTGGVLGNAGTSQTVTMVTGPQLNQGNLVEICESPTTPPQVKVAALQAMTKLQPIGLNEVTSKTTSAVAGIGPKSEQLRPGTTGIDKVIETVGDNADKIADVTKTITTTTGDVTKTVTTTAGDVTENITNTTGDVAKSTVQKVTDSVDNVVDSTQNVTLKTLSTIKIIVIIAAILIIILVIIGIYVYIKYLRKNKKQIQKKSILSLNMSEDDRFKEIQNRNSYI